ncbi:hypothetical protein PENTCL1PPCAC_14400, partial [Pristionchus entomophagus]
VLISLPVILVFAYAVNRRARFVIRCNLLNLTIMLNAFISMILCLPASIFGHACTVVFASMKMLLRWTGIKVETRNFDSVFHKQTSPCVVVCNHQPTLDTIAMAHAFPPRGTVMMKRSLAYIPIFNLSAWLCSVIFVDQFSGGKA